MPFTPQGLQLLSKGSIGGVHRNPSRPHAIPPQQAVLVLSQAGQRHEHDPFFGPSSFGGDGKDLGR